MNTAAALTYSGAAAVLLAVVLGSVSFGHIREDDLFVHTPRWAGVMWNTAVVLAGSGILALIAALVAAVATSW